MGTIIHNDPETNEYYEIVPYPTAGGWLQGHIDASYSDLVGAFGNPTYLGSGDGKTQAEWDLRINGVMCTIYDWKEYGKPVQRIRDWHIGGTDPEATTMVQEALAAWKNNR